MAPGRCRLQSDDQEKSAIRIAFLCAELVADIALRVTASGFVQNVQAVQDVQIVFGSRTAESCHSEQSEESRLLDR